MANFLQIFTLGRPEIHLNGQHLQDFPTRKVEALLLYLAYTGQAHSREALADMFWNERSHSQALSNLRTSLSRLNQQVAEFLQVSRQDIAILPEANLWIDARQFLDGTEDNRVIRSYYSAEKLENLLKLYRGDFLEGFYLRESSGFEEWMLTERRHIAKRLVRLLSWLTNYYLECGDYAQGIRHVNHLLQIEPANEVAYRQHMQLLIQTGQRSAALLEYEKCREILRNEFNTVPESLTEDLHQSILAGQSSTSIRPRLDKLPVQINKILGREAEIARIHEALANPDCRLLTLLGLGGIGKTRLAYEIAESSLRSFAHGLCFLSLAEVDSSEQILPKLAEALRFNFRSPKDPKNQLLNYLRNKEMLVIVDNCEHLLDGLLILSDIISASDSIKILATSREALSLKQEWIIQLEGLPYPEAFDADLENYPAIALFSRTARRVQAGFEMADKAALLEIAQALNGMPLALELAASWVKQLSLGQIAQQVKQNLGLLSSNLRDIPERHRSIQTLFEESWKLLKPEEQNTLMRLALFQGQILLDFALELGVQITHLATLVEKSLIQHNQENFYQLHALLRRFILDKLENTGALAQFSERHALYFAERLANARQPDNPLVIQKLGESYDDYLFGLRWASQQQNLDLLADFILGLAPYWEANFLIVEAMNWLRLALTMISDESSLAALAKIYIYAGVFSRYEPNLPQAQIYLKKGIELSRLVNDSKRLFRGMNMLGHIYALQGEFSESLKIHKEMLEHCYHAEDDYWIARSHNSLGAAALDMEDYTLAKQHLEKALVLYRQINLSRLSTLYGNLGLLYYAEKNWLQAEAYFQESLKHSRSKNELYNVIVSLNNLGNLYLELAQPEAALNTCFEAFESACQYNNKLLQISCIESIAIILGNGYPQFSAYLFGTVDALRAANNFPYEPYNRERYAESLAAIKNSLRAAEFELQWTRGKLADLATVCQQVLNKSWLVP